MFDDLGLLLAVSLVFQNLIPGTLVYLDFPVSEGCAGFYMSVFAYTLAFPFVSASLFPPLCCHAATAADPSSTGNSLTCGVASVYCIY